MTETEGRANGNDSTKIRVRKKVAKEVQPAPDPKDPLKEACEEFDRIGLYEPLSWTLNIEPRGRNLQQLLTSGTSADLCIAGNVMLYESKTTQAKEYFEKALALLTGSASARRHYLGIILANIDVACEIARRYWELTGKAESLDDQIGLLRPTAMAKSS